jgi:hypothetical protein
MVNKIKVRVQVLTAASMKMTVFWDVAPCSLVEVYPTFLRCLLSPSSGPIPEDIHLQ